jgi:hypothetical protein
LASRKFAKVKVAVTRTKKRRPGRSTSQKAAAREWRITNLGWLVDFAYSDVTDFRLAHIEIRDFISKVIPAGYEMLSSMDPAEVDWIHQAARKYLEKTACGVRWTVRLADLVKLDPSFSWAIEPGFRPHAVAYEARNLKAIFLIALVELLGGTDGGRIIRCDESGCGAVFVRRKGGRFCKLHRSGAERARRSRAASKADTALPRRRELRNQRYERHVQKKGGKAAAARVRKREIHAEELLREVISPGLQLAEVRSRVDTPYTRALDTYESMNAEEATMVFGQMLKGGQPALLKKYLAGDRLAKTKVDIILKRIQEGS